MRGAGRVAGLCAQLPYRGCLRIGALHVSSSATRLCVRRHSGSSCSQPPTAWAELAPGVALSATVFMAADALSSHVPVPAIPLALLAGITLTEIGHRAGIVSPELGIQFASQKMLRLGVICVGFKLSLSDVLQSGLEALPIVAITVTTGLVVIPRLGQMFSLSPRLSVLLAAASSICGVTAIAALAPLIGATRKEVAIATANAVAFGAGGMLLYPYLAQAMCHSPEQVGMFLGTAIHDTSQVLGAALGHYNLYGDETVLETATITKLSRVLFLAPALPYLAWSLAADAAGRRPTLKQLLPTFVLGFLGAAALRTGGDSVFTAPLLQGHWHDLIHLLSSSSSYLLGTAMAAVGLSTRLSVFQGVGYTPFAVGFLGAAVVAGTGFTASNVLLSIPGQIIGT